MTSTTTSISGSFRTSLGSVVSKVRSHSGTRSFTRSRTKTLRTTRGAPTRRARFVAFAVRRRMTPPPTVPQPRSAKLTDFFEVRMSLDRGRNIAPWRTNRYLPPNMRAIVLRRVGGPEELELCDLPPPEPAAGEVLVRVMAEGVCGRDLIDRRGG